MNLRVFGVVEWFGVFNFSALSFLLVISPSPTNLSEQYFVEQSVLFWQRVCFWVPVFCVVIGVIVVAIVYLWREKRRELRHL